MLFMCFSPHPYWEKGFCRYIRVSPSSPVRERCCVCMSVYNCTSALTLIGKKNSVGICVFHHHVQWEKDVAYV
jgi:hypothetical protein